MIPYLPAPSTKWWTGNGGSNECAAPASVPTVSTPKPAIGASSASQRARGVDPWRSGLGPVILFNLALPFLFPNLNISIGGHVGGLIGGAVAALAIERLAAIRKGDLLPVLACALVGVISVVGAISVASG